LHSGEEQQFAQLDDAARWQFICSRVALKDAARLFITNHSGWLVHPAQLLIEHSPSGRPELSVPEGWPVPAVSVAHSESAAIALAGACDVGIDLEPVDRDTAKILGEFAAAEEIELIESLCQQQPDEAWPTRLWCAKEAVAKVLGIGLQGRPKDFCAIDVSETSQILIDHAPSGQRYAVNTVRINQFVVAYTSAESLIFDPVSTAH
jgi:phosphopantetheinyl transferase